MYNRKDTRTLIQNALSAAKIKDEQISRDVFYAYSKTLTGLDKDEAKIMLENIINNSSIWAGYQEYNRIMRMVNDDHFNLDSKDVSERRRELVKFLSTLN